MRDYGELVEIKKCLYPYDSGVIQVNIQRSSDDCIKPRRASASWSPMIEIPARQSEHPQGPSLTLFDTMITCALHPTLSPNERISWFVNRFRLQHISGIDLVYPQSQFRNHSSTIFCDLPHLYTTADAFPDTEDTSWKAFNAIISLLQMNFRLGKQIFLILWTKDTIFPREPLPPHDLIKAGLEKVLRRVDEFFRVLASHGCDFTIFPSPAAFNIYLNQAKETGGFFEEGNIDLSRGAESRVWRTVIMDSSKGEASKDSSEKAKSGYWVQTSFFDWLERPNMQFV